MDNITHTLVGITVGQALAGRQRSQRDRAAIVWASVIANNLPDLDFILRRWDGDLKLGYLLQHRGFTHTVALALPLAAVAAMAGSWIAGRDLTRVRKCAGVGLLGLMLHMAADACNDYGIHPFWPFSGRWFYGDFVFIVEPLVLFALLPFVILGPSWSPSTGVNSTGVKWTRWGWSAIALGFGALVWTGPFIPWQLAIWMTAWAAGIFYLQSGRKSSVVVPIGSVALVLVAFFGTSRIARAQVEGLFSRNDPGARLLQLGSTPAPGNPLCWRVLLASESSAHEYQLRLGAVSLLPSWFSPETCFYRLAFERTAPLSASTLPESSGVHWTGEFRSTVQEFSDLAATKCRFRALLRFYRMPFWTRDLTGSASAKVAGDLRYDNERGLGFSEFRLDESEGLDGCSQYVPPWEPPMHELISRSAQGSAAP